jgi:uncharacterized membrane protein
MAKSLIALGTAAALGAVTLTTTPNPAAAQAWLVPVIVGSLVTGAFSGAAGSPYYGPYDYYNNYYRYPYYQSSYYRPYYPGYY